MPYPNSEDLLRSIGEVFKDVRQEAGFSQRQAAALADSTQANICYLERGTVDSRISTLQRWAHAYGYEVQVVLSPLVDEETENFNALFNQAMEELESEDTISQTGVVA